jgi:endo-1,4-beta-D-glucanase Y
MRFTPIGLGPLLLGAGLLGCSSPNTNDGTPAVMPSVTGTQTMGTSTSMMQPDGSIVTMAPDGSIVTMAPDGTITTMTPDGMVVTMPPTGTTTGGTTTTPPTTTTAPTSTDGTTTPPPATDMGPVWINAQGRVDAARNTFGIHGDWYAFGDGVTSTQSGNPYREGKYCVTGTADGMSGNWGAGMGLDLNGGTEKMPYAFAGKVTGFRIKITGEAPVAPRLNFIIDPDLGVNPFIEATIGESLVYSIADAQVPFTWEVDNAGQRVADVLYSLQLLAPGDSAAGPIDICIEEFEPIFDETAGTGTPQGTTFINPDGFVTAESNTYGVQGPVYTISDGTSTTVSGVPFKDGKYCVSGEFTGATDAWGAGIAFDLNHAPGGAKEPLEYAGKVAGMRFGLSGNTPGNIRIQYVLNEPQTGNQPFLVGQLNASAVYPLAWAQVPTSWEVDDAGLEIGTSVYTVQVYIEGDKPGPFEVCVDEMAPVSPEELTYAAEPAAAGFSGFRTIDDATLAAEYAIWKERHFQDCGDGSACIPRDEGDCISEGVAYGMLLTVGNDDQDAFDKLWAYFSKHKNAAGVMKWQTNACGTATAEGSATDGDLDAAMALIQAGCKWGGSYQADALTLINAIATSAVATGCGSGAVLKPGNNFGGCTETDPSYVAPAYYKVFAELTSNSVWTSLTDSGYTLLAGNQMRKNGLFSDWSNDSGGVSAGSHSDDFGPDASRVPWRLAMDYIWNGEMRAADLLDTFAAAVEAEGGVSRAFTPNSNYRGGSAFAYIHKDAASAHEARDAWLMTSVDDQSYFPGTLRPVYMLLAANKFPKGCN